MMANKHDIRIDRSKLHPRLDVMLGNFLTACEKSGLYLIITEGFRTKEYQDELYAKGRTAKGNIVTYARGSEYKSQHQWGIAFDIAINDKSRTYEAALMKKAGLIGKKIGLGWGGDWKSMIDTPHFYLPEWGSGTVTLLNRYKTFACFKKTWTAKVTREAGVYLYKDKLKTKKIMTIPKGESVDIILRKTWYAKVRYKSKVGYVKQKFITS